MREIGRVIDPYARKELARIAAMLANLESVSFMEVPELPETGVSNIIYLVPNSEGTKDEYMWLASQEAWDKIGTTTINLDGYVLILAQDDTREARVENAATGGSLNVKSKLNVTEARVKANMDDASDIGGLANGEITGTYTELYAIDPDGAKTRLWVHANGNVYARAKDGNIIQLHGLTLNNGTLYLDTRIGNDANDGLTQATAVRSMNRVLGVLQDYAIGTGKFRLYVRAGKEYNLVNIAGSSTSSLLERLHSMGVKDVEFYGYRPDASDRYATVEFDNLFLVKQDSITFSGYALATGFVRGRRMKWFNMLTSSTNPKDVNYSPLTFVDCSSVLFYLTALNSTITLLRSYAEMSGTGPSTSPTSFGIELKGDSTLDVQATSNVVVPNMSITLRDTSKIISTTRNSLSYLQNVNVNFWGGGSDNKDTSNCYQSSKRVDVPVQEASMDLPSGSTGIGVSFGMLRSCLLTLFNGASYSMNEQLVGNSVDGIRIYKRTVFRNVNESGLTIPVGASTLSTGVFGSTSYVAEVIKLEWSANHAGNLLTGSPSYCGIVPSETWTLAIFYSSSDDTLQARKSTAATVYNLTITLYYTKTNDQW
ncbi:MAG: hypothetical protein LBP56_05265 [Odoribacteraceae bacterium]|jgi:hypothetical protein|nr:hypothetical protein [Odoribacteraceae bacterium]